MDDFDAEIADEQPNMFAMKEYRLLTPLFCRLLSVPATSAPAEREFSQGGLIMRPYRARMEDALLEMLIHLSCSGNWVTEQLNVK